MEKKLVIHFISYENEMMDRFAYYADAIMFDDEHIGLTVRKMPNGYNLYVSTLEYADARHRKFKEKFIVPLLDDKGYIKGNNYGKGYYTQFGDIEIRYVILNEININFEQSNGK